MTKVQLIKEIEDDGRYDRVRIDAKGNVTGHPVDEPDRYDAHTNTGGRRFIGRDTELLAALIECGQIDKEVGNTYAWM